MGETNNKPDKLVINFCPPPALGDNLLSFYAGGGKLLSPPPTIEDKMFVMVGNLYNMVPR